MWWTKCKISHFKEIRITNNTQDFFNDEVTKAIKLSGKRCKKFRSTKVHIDENLYQKAKYHALKLIKQNKNHFYKENKILGNQRYCGKL